jgi:hypothetical protein
MPQFVGAHPVVDAGLFNRVAGIAQVYKVDAFDHSSVLDIQAGNDALG